MIGLPRAQATTSINVVVCFGDACAKASVFLCSLSLPTCALSLSKRMSPLELQCGEIGQSGAPIALAKCPLSELDCEDDYIRGGGYSIEASRLFTLGSTPLVRLKRHVDPLHSQV